MRPVTVRAQQPAAVSGEDRSALLVDSTEAFAFFSDPGVNLYDFLYWRAQENGPADEATGCLNTLPEDQRQAWEVADAHYRETMGERHHRTDNVMVALRYHLAGFDVNLVPDDQLVAELEVLVQAAPAYRACWWPAHDARNREWITALVSRLETYEDTLKARLAHLYQYPWPDRVPVDVVGYASWGGANTVVNPHHIMVSGANPEYRGDAALEMVFHEASHTIMGGRQGATAEALARAGRAHDKPLPGSLWHAILFYTAGKVTQDVLAADGVKYTPYMYANSVFAGSHSLLEQYWQPYLDGEVDLPTAARTLVAALSNP